MQSFLITEARVLEALQQVYDPELGVNVVDLGLVYGLAIEGSRVRVTMTLTTPGCPLHGSLAEAVEAVVQSAVPGVEAVDVDVVWDPPWTPERMSEAGRSALGWE